LDWDEPAELSHTPITSAPTKPEHQTRALAKNSSYKNQGIQFRRWLMKRITDTKKDNNIVTTQSGVALLYPDIFKQYANEQGNMEWKNIETEFIKLNLHAINTSSQHHIHQLHVPGMGKREALLITSMKKQ